MRYAFLALLGIMLSGCTLSSNVGGWDFGTVYVGETSTSGNITWKNTGNDQVNFLGVMGSWSAGSPYSLLPATYTGTTLGPNGVSNPVQVVFAPTASGTYTGTMDPIRNVGAGKTVTADTVKVQGVAVAQVAKGDLSIGGTAITPGSALDFGSVRANAGPAVSLRVDVVNISNAAIQVQARFKKGNEGFSIVSPGANFAVPANGRKVTVKLQFLPTTVGTHWDVIEFVDAANGANICATSLTGVGTE